MRRMRTCLAPPLIMLIMLAILAICAMCSIVLIVLLFFCSIVLLLYCFTALMLELRVIGSWYPGRYREVGATEGLRDLEEQKSIRIA